MRRNHKLIALCLIAVMMVSLLSACAGQTYDDGKYTGDPIGVSKLYEDAFETNQVGNKTVYVDAPAAETPTDNSTSNAANGENTTGGETNGENPTDENTTGNGTTGENPTDENTGTDTEQPADDEEYEDYNTVCMSFNILEWDTHYTGYAAPAVRAPWIVDTINRYDPDLLGTQEVTKGSSSTANWDMCTYLIEQLSGKYDCRTLMDEKGKAGSTVAVSNLTIGSGLIIFWKKDRFELKDSGAKVYSVDSARHFQWVKLYDKQEDITILMTNTHLSINPSNDVAAGDSLRLTEANELYNFWNTQCQEGMAMYGTGDFNSTTATTAFQSLNKGRFVSSRDVSGRSNANSSIDFVYINGDVQACYQYTRANETYEPDGVTKGDVDKRNVQYCPSDHYAVVAYCSNEYL